MVEERVNAGAGALSDWLRRCRASVEEVRGGTFGKLRKCLLARCFCVELRYGAVGGSLGQEEVQMRMVRIFMGMGRLHPLASLQFEMNMLPVN